MAIFDLQISNGGAEEAIRLSRLAAYIARALNLLGSEVKETTIEKLKEETLYFVTDNSIVDDDNVTILNVIKQLLNFNDA